MVGNLKSIKQSGFTRANSDKSLGGFTIIEVLIVLAIAGLIMLIVFLAVPALQRNSRNTTRRNDVATYLAAVNEYITNSNGRLPTSADNITTINGLANTSSNTTEPTAVTAGTTAQTAVVALDTLVLVTGAKCDTTNIGDTVPATGRSFVVRFSVEDSGGGATKQCQES